MKKFMIVSLAVVGGYLTFLKVSETLERQSIWHQVTDTVK